MRNFQYFFKKFRWRIFKCYSRIIINTLMSQKNLNKKQKGVAPFIFKLYQLLEDPDSLPYAFWQKQSSMFTISNVEQFCKILLPKYYKHRNFSSFVRQLNIYGFAKTKVDSTEHTYYHLNFNHEFRNKLKLIKRRCNLTKQNEGQQEFQNSLFQHQQNNQFQANESSTKIMNKQLGSRLNQISEKNKRLREQNQKLLKTSTKIMAQILGRNYMHSILDEAQEDFITNQLQSNKPIIDVMIQFLKKFKKVEKIQSVEQQTQNKQQKIEKKSLQLQQIKNIAYQKTKISENKQEAQIEDSFKYFQESLSQNFEFFTNFNNLNQINSDLSQI